ncbi:DUF6544 family protein [Enterococcus florum]|nr:DUF6544 family protein [Enterococcus florum]
MGLTAGILLIVLGGIIAYESVGYSPVKRAFHQQKQQLVEASSLGRPEVFSKQEIARLPRSLRKYLEHCGFAEQPKMRYSIAKFESVDFVLNVGQKPLKIDYERVNDGNQPNALALIDTRLYGIPFQGIDAYVNNQGSMKGVLGKQFTLFDETREDFYISCLVTYLSECLIVPSVVFQDFITWEEVDSQTVKGTLKHSGYEVSGIFYFSARGELERFTTEDRIAIDPSGNKSKAPWTAKFSEYVEENGLLHPKRLQAIWHYPAGDSIYFDGEMVSLQYGYDEKGK